MRLCRNSKAAHEEKEIEKHIKETYFKQEETSKETSRRIITVMLHARHERGVVEAYQR